MGGDNVYRGGSVRRWWAVRARYYYTGDTADYPPQRVYTFPSKAWKIGGKLLRAKRDPGKFLSRSSTDTNDYWQLWSDFYFCKQGNLCYLARWNTLTLSLKHFIVHFIISRTLMILDIEILYNVSTFCTYLVYSKHCHGIEIFGKICAICRQNLCRVCTGRPRLQKTISVVASLEHWHYLSIFRSPFHYVTGFG